MEPTTHRIASEIRDRLARAGESRHTAAAATGIPLPVLTDVLAESSPVMVEDLYELAHFLGTTPLAIVQAATVRR